MKAFVKKSSCIVLMLGIVIGNSGCASKYMAKHHSVGAIGCVASEISIADEKLDILGYTTWIATCKGKTYVCQHSDGEGTNCHQRE